MSKVKLYQALRLLEKRSTVPLVVVCLYEAAALTFPTRHLPPITVLSHKHKWVFPVFCALLGLHIKCYAVQESPRA